MGRRLRLQSTLIGLLIALGCVAMLWRQVDLKQSWTTLSRLNGPLLVIPLFVFFVSLLLRAWRWQLIFPPSSRPGFGSCFTILGIGNMGNFLLPGRAGDLSRCVLVGRAGSLKESSRALATLAVEKVLDGMALVGMSLFAAWALHPPHWVVQLLRLSSAIFAAILALLVIIRYRTPALLDVMRRGFRRVHLSRLEEKFDHGLTSFSDGLSAIGSVGQMVWLLMLTAAIWIMEVVSVWGLAAALGLTIPLKSSAVATAVLGLGLMIPAAPGSLGSYELFGTEAFKLVGLTSSRALALTIVVHAWVFAVNVAVGMGLLAVKGLSLRKLHEELEASPQVETSDQESAVRPAV